ncbi:MAG TPA: serine hydrolase, partial [Candidatus Saccharimonadales bacterium]|nr:serine hydrolase [Candidatus Saccharimonadales bacterium]
GLNDGTLVSGDHRNRLLSSLGRHPYRYGIPTGSAGIVHDKVGFLWDYVHDTAIVQHPRGTYLMTIMTKGQSYGAIASVTRQIERIMYP